jgi:hypothetical protein
LPNDLKDSAERAGLAELNEIVLKACADDPGQRYRWPTRCKPIWPFSSRADR